MATYNCYIEASASATAGVVTGTGIISDPWIGQGDDVWNYALDNIRILWGAGVGGNPAWAAGDNHVVNASNKEAYIFDKLAQDNITLPAAWTGGDTALHGLTFRVWETTTAADGGTFNIWPSGEKTACVELDGTRTVLNPFSIATVAAVYASDFYVHSFTSKCWDGTLSVLENSIIENYDSEAIDTGTGVNLRNVWFKGAYDTAAFALDGANYLRNCLFGAQPTGSQTKMDYAVGFASTYNVAVACVFDFVGISNEGILIDGNQDYIAITDCIFVGTGAANEFGISIEDTALASQVTIRNCLFVNFNGTGSHPVTTRTDLSSSSDGTLLALQDNYYYNCNANDIGVILGKGEEEGAVTLTNNPIYNASAYDYRLISSPELERELQVAGGRYKMMYGPWGNIDIQHAHTRSGRKSWLPSGRKTE